MRGFVRAVKENTKIRQAYLDLPDDSWHRSSPYDRTIIRFLHEVNSGKMKEKETK